MSSSIRRLIVDGVKVILPTLIAFLIFVAAVFGYFLPAFEHAVMLRKQDSLRELTAVAWHILDGYHGRELRGEISRAEAQRRAIEVLRTIRYGNDQQEYYWINDLDFRMIMHPYRQDLEGQILKDYTDPSGKHVFREFVELGKTQGQGFVTYLWQWHGDASRIEPKLSHLRIYEPWQWMVGTGLYLDDVRRETGKMSSRVNISASVLFAFLLVLALYIIRNGILVARARERAERELIRHQHQLEKNVAERTAELQATNENLQHEIAERRQLAAKLEVLSSSDELTGLLNRRGFVDTAAHRLAEAERRNETLFLVYADLDNMKAINDRLGHKIGDEALKAFAAVLHECFRASDIIGRLGGDEFVTLLAGDAEYGDERRILARIEEKLESFNNGQHEFRLQASAGVAHYRPGRGTSLEDLLAQSDSAMYHRKLEKKQKREE